MSSMSQNSSADFAALLDLERQIKFVRCLVNSRRSPEYRRQTWTLWSSQNQNDRCQIRQKYINQHTFLFNGLCMQQASKTKAEQTTALASALTAAICTTNQLNTVKPRNYGRLSDEEEFLINVNSQIIAEY